MRRRPGSAASTASSSSSSAYAQTWQTKEREVALRRQLLTDGHAPARYRALAVRNLDPWYAAFDVQPGQALYLAPEARVKVW